MGSRAQKILNLLKNNQKQEEQSLIDQGNSSFFAETSSSKENYDALNCEIIESSTECTDSLKDNNFHSSQVFIVQADRSLVQISNAVTSTDTTTTDIATDSLPPLDDSLIPNDGISDSNVVSDVIEEINVGVIEEKMSIIDSTISLQVPYVIVKTNNNGLIEKNTSVIDNTISLQVPDVIQQTNNNNGSIEKNASVIDSSVPRQANENEHTINIAGDNIEKDQMVSPKRRKRHRVNERKWESKKAKILREKGEEYHGRKLVGGKSKFSVVRPK